MKGCSFHETYRKGCSKCAEAQPAPAPLPEEVKEAVARLKVSVQNVVMGGWKQAIPDLDTLLRSISDLTRRLAEAEGERDSAKMRGDNHAETLRGVRRMLSDAQPDTKRVLLWVSDGLFGYSEPLEATLLKANDERNDANTRAEAAERELEELKRSTK